MPLAIRCPSMGLGWAVSRVIHSIICVRHLPNWRLMISDKVPWKLYTKERNLEAYQGTKPGLDIGHSLQGEDFREEKNLTIEKADTRNGLSQVGERCIWSHFLSYSMTWDICEHFLSPGKLLKEHPANSVLAQNQTSLINRPSAFIFAEATLPVSHCDTSDVNAYVGDI